MSFGQYTTGTRHYYPSPPEPGRRTKAEILKGVYGPLAFIKARVTAHNEVTRWLKDGTCIVRLITTDILIIAPSRLSFQLNNGGWYTPTTTSHMTAALERNSFFGFSVWCNCRKKGVPRMILRTPTGHEEAFQRRKYYDL